MTVRTENKLELGKLKTHKDAVRSEALLLGMEHIRGIAVPRTPVETGHLAGSAEVKTVDDHTAGLEFPGPYARYQHYELQLHHETGQALFEESAINDGAQDALKIVGRSVFGAL